MARNIAYFEPGNGFIASIMLAASRADANSKSLRIEVGNGWIKYKVGEEMWSPALWTGVDPKQ